MAIKIDRGFTQALENSGLIHTLDVMDQPRTPTTRTRQRRKLLIVIILLSFSVVTVVGSAVAWKRSDEAASKQAPSNGTRHNPVSTIAPSVEAIAPAEQQTAKMKRVKSGSVTETFDTASTTEERGWEGKGNTSGGNRFGWDPTDVVLGNGSGGTAGGVFVRSKAYCIFADTRIGKFDRTSTLHLAGRIRLANVNFDGNFGLGYFNYEQPGLSNNFFGIHISEPSGSPTSPFRGYIGLAGAGGDSTAAINLPQNSLLHIDLTWKGNEDGSGEITGSIAGMNVSVSVNPGSGTFTAFGLFCGGSVSSEARRKTAGCYFDNLTYDKAGN